MNRFKRVIAFHLPTAAYYYVKMRRQLKKNGTVEEDYKVCKEVVSAVSKKAKGSVEVFGLENLPSENENYILCPNHQGKFDGLAVVTAMDRPVAFLIDSARSDMVFEKEFMDLNRAKRISLKNPSEAIKALRAMRDGVLDGHVHCVFPEGGYSDNHNNLQDFRSGCLHYIKAMKCSVVPVCLYDSWKVLGTSIRGPIKAQIHFLKPIEPKEIESLTKAELATLIKERIENKLSQLRSLN